jgi:hypothetical protein
MVGKRTSVDSVHPNLAHFTFRMSRSDVWSGLRDSVTREILPSGILSSFLKSRINAAVPNYKSVHRPSQV